VVPGGCSHGAGDRGVKNPNAPLPRAKYALIWFSHCRTASLFAASNRSLQSQYGLAVTRSQNTRSLATRASGALPEDHHLACDRLLPGVLNGVHGCLPLCQFDSMFPRRIDEGPNKNRISIAFAAE
jgi:hypothetical protein